MDKGPRFTCFDTLPPDTVPSPTATVTPGTGKAGPTKRAGDDSLMEGLVKWDGRESSVKHAGKL